MFELYGYGEYGEYLVETFDSREEMVGYMEDNEMLSDYEDGYFGRCPDGEEIYL